MVFYLTCKSDGACWYASTHRTEVVAQGRFWKVTMLKRENTGWTSRKKGSPSKQ